jgi:hypothetical protein
LLTRRNVPRRTRAVNFIGQRSNDKFGPVTAWPGVLAS